MKEGNQKARQITPSDRLRSGQACASCRKGKNRCDGLRPKCTYCIRRNVECDYSPNPKRPRLSSSFVNSLEEKIRMLEARMNSGESSSGQNAIEGQETNIEYAQESTTINDFPLSPTSVKDVFELEDSQSLEVLEFGGVSLFSAVSDLGSMPATDKVNKSAVSPSRSVARSPSIIQPSPTGVGVVRSTDELPDEHFQLPERTIAEMLTENFFKHVYPFFPFVDEHTFRTHLALTYDQKTQSRQRQYILWLSLMNLVFAFGCDYVDLPLLKIQSLSRIFAGRANDLIISVCFEIGTLEVLQSLLLLSIHLLSNMQLNKCWASVGCLVRTGQGLGLHLNSSQWNISPLEKEMRKRLWWGIYCLDRFTSAKHGRPPAIVTHPTPTSSPTLDLESPSEKEGPQMTPVPLFKHTVELARITESIVISVFKTPWLLPGKPATYAAPVTTPQAIGIHVEIAVEHERMLSEWKRSLPADLQFEGTVADLQLDNQRVALVVRYLHTQLLLHRQVLVALTRRPDNPAEIGESSFIDAVAGASVSQCIKSACILAELIQATFDSKRIGAWWYNTSFLFTSLGTLFAAVTQPCLAQYITNDLGQITSSIQKGLEVIEKVGDINEVTQQCREYFFALYKTIEIQQNSTSDVPALSNMPSISTMLASDIMYSNPVDQQNTGGQNGLMNDLLSGDWNAIYGAADIFKDPLLPEFGLSWLDM